MEYYELRNRTLTDIENDLSSNEVEKATEALLDLLESTDDFPYLKSQFLKYAYHDEFYIANTAILCIAHLSRYYPFKFRLDFDDFNAVLLDVMEKNEDLTGVVEQTFWDIKMSCFRRKRTGKRFLKANRIQRLSPHFPEFDD